MAHNSLPVAIATDQWNWRFCKRSLQCIHILLYTVYVTEAPPVSQRASQYQEVTVKCWHVTGQLREALVSHINVLSWVNRR